MYYLVVKFHGDRIKMSKFKVGDCVRVNFVNSIFHNNTGMITKIFESINSIDVDIGRQIISVHGGNLEMVVNATPYMFKVGDRVKVKLDLPQPKIGTFKQVEENATIIEGTVSDIRYGIKTDDGVVWESVHVSRLKPLEEEKSFIKQVIDGAKIHKDTPHGVKNFEFCGYLVKGMQHRTVGSKETYFAIDEHGNAQSTFEYGKVANFKFDIQPEKEKVKIHCVAYTVMPGFWATTTLSDEELNKMKHGWYEYKILETQVI